MMCTVLVNNTIGRYGKIVRTHAQNIDYYLHLQSLKALRNNIQHDTNINSIEIV